MHIKIIKLASYIAGWKNQRTSKHKVKKEAYDYDIVFFFIRSDNTNNSLAEAKNQSRMETDC